MAAKDKTIDPVLCTPDILKSTLVSATFEQSRKAKEVEVIKAVRDLFDYMGAPESASIPLVGSYVMTISVRVDPQK